MPDSASHVNEFSSTIAGCIIGLAEYVEADEVDGRPLIERYPRLGYVLG